LLADTRLSLASLRAPPAAVLALRDDVLVGAGFGENAQSRGTDAGVLMLGEAEDAIQAGASDP
jgi:hypothetical protein